MAASGAEDAETDAVAGPTVGDNGGVSYARTSCGHSWS